MPVANGKGGGASRREKKDGLRCGVQVYSLSTNNPALCIGSGARIANITPRRRIHIGPARAPLYINTRFSRISSRRISTRIKLR